VTGARVTVVVATRDRRDDLRRSLPRHEGPVIVVDNGSADDSPDVAAYLGASVIRLGRNRGAVARNVGVRAARTPYVAFADDDSWWEPGALELAAGLLDAHPRLALVAGRILVGQEGRLEPLCELMARSPLPRPPDSPGPAVLGFMACGAVVRRSAFLDSGGFDAVTFFAGEEERLALDLAARGWDLAYCPDVVAHHVPSVSRDDDLRREVRIRRNVLLTAVMRRPARHVAQAFRDAVRSGRAGRHAIAAAAWRLPAALRARRRLPQHVEVARRLLDHQLT